MRNYRKVKLNLGWDSTLALVLLSGSIIFAGVVGSPYWSNVFGMVGVLGIVALWNQVLLGQAGQVSFGQAAVMGAGAYGTAIAMTQFGLPYGISIFVGIAGAVAVSVLFALPAQRVESYYLGFVTLAAGLAFVPVIRHFSGITGGIRGISVTTPELNTLIFGQLSWRNLLIAVLAAVAVIVQRHLRASRTGRLMLMAKTSPEAVETLGVSPGRLRAYAFILSGLMTGVAGALYVPMVGYVGTDAFSVDLSLLFFFAVIAGGSSYASGAVLGMWLLYMLPNVFLVGFVEYRLLAYGIIVFLIMLFIPDGIVGRIDRIVKRHRRARSGMADLNVGQQVHDLFKDSAIEEQKVRDGSTKPKSDKVPAVLSATNVSKSFGAVVALNGVSIEIVPGTITGIVGPNGCGKTSLLNILSGLMKPDKGTLSLDGVDVSRMAASTLARRGVGRTFQTPRVFSELDMWEHIKVGLEAPVAGRNASRFAETMRELAPKWTGLEATALPHGSQRLMEILRVVAREPRVLLLDEPAAGLSAVERNELAVLLDEIRSRLGTAIVLVEHDLSLVWRVTDRIIVMDQGTITESGRPQDVRDRPSVAALFLGSTDA